MKQTWTIILACILSAAVAYTVAEQRASDGAAPKTEKKQESVYDRVMRTGKIRCGYANRTPILIKSPKTGELEGIFYEYAEALGNALGLEIEWVAEVGWGDAVEYLRTDKIDAFCAGLWPVSHRASHIDFIHPVLFEPLFAYTRSDIKRFDNNLEAINQPDVKIVAVEGGAPYLVGNHDFPKAQKVDLPQLTPLSDIYLYVDTGKADVVLSEMPHAADYMNANPGRLRMIPLERPIRSFGLSLATKANEYQFKRMLDLGTMELLQTGQIEKILNKYEEYPHSFYRPARPYEQQK